VADTVEDPSAQQAARRRRPRILVVYCCGTFPIRATIWEHLYSFRRYSGGVCRYVNLSLGAVPAWVARQPWDVIVYHTIFLASRWSLPAFEKFRRRAAPLKEHAAVRVALPQDEFIHTDVLCDFIEEFQIDRVCSVAPPSEWPKIYAGVDRDRVVLERVLTGYIDEATVRRVERLAARRGVDRQRPVDIAYRAFHSPPWLGRHGRTKVEIADRFEEAARSRGLTTDISTRQEDTLLGDRWYEHLLDAKYTIGVEGGASILDRDGALRVRTERYLEEHPNASFDEVERACFPDADGELDLCALSPRHLEACFTRTCQVLVEGEYNGVLEAGVHCIELQRDFGNLDEVLRAIEDDDRREAIVEAAWRDIVASGKYTYRGFVAKVVSDALEGQSEKNAPRLTIGQRIAAAWLAVRDPLTWCVVAVGCRVRSALRRIGRRRTA